MPPVLTRCQSTISVDSFIFKSLLQSLFAGVTSKTHFKANFSSVKSKRFSLKWKRNSHVCGIGCLESKLPSPPCVYTLDPVIELNGIKDNYVASNFPQINNVHPLLKSSSAEAIPAVRSHESTFAIMERAEEEFQNLTGNAAAVEYRESMGRKKISQANKGKVPWNKGRKHTPETIALIRERTTQAMQDREVRKKLVQPRLRHSDSAKARIGASVKMRYDQLRNRKLLQETFIHEWGESIAEAARRGGNGDDELNWNSYELLKAEMKQELFPARKKSTAKMEIKHSCKRMGLSDRHKLKISQAMKAKWADPSYQRSHQLGMHKFHGSTPPPAVRTKIVDGEKSSKPVKLLGGQTSTMQTSESLRLPSSATNRSKTMVKIRAATEQTRSLIAETEKAAKLLEPAAVKYPALRASLLEAHKLLAEAFQLLDKTEAWTNSMATILPRKVVTSIDAKKFQPHDCRSQEQLPIIKI